MPNIFVIQEMQHHNYKAAEKYGNLVFVNNRDINSKFGVLGTPNNREIVQKMIRTLRRFDINDDYLIVDGNPLLFALAVNYLSEIGCKYDERHIKILKWDNREYEYVLTDYPKLSEVLFDKETKDDDKE